MAKNRATHVVVDTVAFFKNVQLQEIAETVYTVPDVVSEIKDGATRKRLAVLPYELKYREPSSASIQTISEFAKKTGDYHSLSSVDLRVLALAYQLTKEHGGIEHLKLAPEKKVTLTSNTRPLQKATDIVGFYLPPKDTKNKDNKEEAKTEETQTEETQAESTPHQDTEENQDVQLNLSKLNVEENSDKRTERVANRDSEGLEEQQVEQNTNTDSNQPTSEVIGQRSQDDLVNSSSTDAAQADTASSGVAPEDDKENVETDGVEGGDGIDGEDDADCDEENEEGEDGDDNDGWITPQNISRIREGGVSDRPEGVGVGCMTADFAMQNVLIQIGIPVLSVNGMLIRSARSFVLRCRGCFKITNKMDKVFCPHCGNKTLNKVTMTTGEDGSQRIHLSQRKVINKRGMKFPLPLPKGGKHADNPILVADQPIAHNHLSRKAQMKTDIFNSDYVSGTSPFALNDTTSKSAQLGVRGFTSNAAHNRRNPNQVKPRKGRKK
ncbi:RNA-binding protein NOB1-like [Asterias amurensis]|uniref:RNA-binding protein NOB1-like n=1 Tax=Asterias amurensis TaxID=7602 RepID=UPI003AB5E24C